MQLLTIGVNHDKTPVAIREKLQFANESLPAALDELTRCPGVREAVILSTCNRTELYCHTDFDATADSDPTDIIDWLGRFHSVASDELNNYLYLHPDDRAVRHILRVASGLDSLIIGEPQILGQLKQAYSVAQHHGATGKLLSRLFQHAFAVAKQVRTDTAIGHSPVSVAFAAVRLAQQIFGDLGDQTALLIGAGETIELAARHLNQNGIGRIVVANRTEARARLLASEFNGYAISIAEIPSHLAEADIVISSTAAPLPILGKGAVEQASKKRRHRPMFLVDIAVPRDIEPEVAELEDVYLYTVDDLHDVIEENMRSRRQAAEQAEDIINTQVSHFRSWVQSLDALPTIKAIRERADQTRRELLDRAGRQLAAGMEPQQVMDELSYRLTNRLLHEPSTRLNEAGVKERHDLLDAARTLFGIQDDEQQP